MTTASAFAQTTPSAQQPTPQNVDEYIQMVRTGVQKDKAQLIGEALDLDATQAAAFWPVYKQYEAEFAKIGDARYAGIKDYAANYGSITDAKATELIDLALRLEEQRLALIKRYLGEFRKVLPGVKAARYSPMNCAALPLPDRQPPGRSRDSDRGVG